MLDVAKNAIVRALIEPACAACGALLERPLAGAVCEQCWFGHLERGAAVVCALR
jgi:hypothetical protein